MQSKKAVKTSKTRKTPVLPSSLSVLGKPVAIKWSDELRSPGSMKGACNNTDSTIWLSTQLAPAQLQDTAIHEVLHLVSDELALGLEEETVARLACGLYSAGVRLEAVRHLEEK